MISEASEIAIIFKDEIEADIFKFCEQLYEIISSNQSQDEMIESYTRTLFFIRFLSSEKNRIWEKIKERLLKFEMMPLITPAKDEIFFESFPEDRIPNLNSLLSAGLGNLEISMLRRVLENNKGDYPDGKISGDELLKAINMYPNNIVELTEVFSVDEADAVKILEELCESQVGIRAEDIIRSLFSLAPVLATFSLRGFIGYETFLRFFSKIKEYGLKEHFHNDFLKKTRRCGLEKLNTGIRLFMKVEY